jgi:putative transposase
LLAMGISMTQSCDPKETLVAERMNGILKQDWWVGKEFATMRHVQVAAKEAIAIYNKERLHSSCDYMPPENAHKGTGPLRKRWKNLRKERAEARPKAAEENENVPA